MDGGNWRKILRLSTDHDILRYTVIRNGTELTIYNGELLYKTSLMNLRTDALSNLPPKHLLVNWVGFLNPRGLASVRTVEVMANHNNIVYAFYGTRDEQRLASIFLVGQSYEISNRSFSKLPSPISDSTYLCVGVGPFYSKKLLIVKNKITKEIYYGIESFVKIFTGPPNHVTGAASTFIAIVFSVTLCPDVKAIKYYS